MRRGEAGFTFVGVLAALAVVSAGLAVAGPLWQRQAQREREAELLRAGRLYAEAIRQYYVQSPGAAKQYPPDLESLLYDDRFVGVRRHLRKLYPDPLTPGRPWGVVRGEDGHVRGVYSLSHAAPLRATAVDLGVVVLPPATRYSDWKFIPNFSM